MRRTLPVGRAARNSIDRAGPGSGTVQHARFAPLPAHGLVDETLHLRVEGLEPGARVRLRLASAGAPGTMWMAEATFVADAGDVDLTRDAPLEGSYAGVDPMGLFWSRAAVPGVPGETAADPAVVTLTARDASGQAFLRHELRRSFLAAGVRQASVDAAGLVARLFTPPARGPHPTMIVLGGSDGGFRWCSEVASLLASRGFATLALAYFGIEPLPPTLDRIPLEYFERAIDWLSAHPAVDPRRIGVIGASRGGELALLLGATFPALRAVVAYVPSGILWPGVPQMDHAAWTWQGRELPTAGQMPLADWQRMLADAGLQDDTPEAYQLVLHDLGMIEAATIPVERIHGPILFITGRDDRLWPCEQLTGFALRRLQERGFAHRVEHLSYGGAGHAIGWPHVIAPATRTTHPVTRAVMDLGGTPAANARAAADSWPRMLDFLQRSL
ncbi:acyl-CoA thioester hydrolase/BAAT C-terminal domain-containing protein [Piscinibacter koreensis]|uniref:Acyl-CoA thioesterase/BAAT N-terminal domain-containing protein n=1 Tax=Piscinibacter koreensis TaxID=2742824 RepID=A0A7Y6NMY1_9BURK|nr:acyl-CoA thioester hydrolase/BAAT C-terminal domain-containing protein [Schlegelella koreensis]NUZ06044.1 acyl-CoA thioesterase/BAAT N-terminal domain-containing protein [Schlegelella koreensis]